MTKSKTFLQIVLATAITILSVVAIASATTIGTNISTGGTLNVTGATTLSSDLTVSGNTVFSGIASSTSALVASSTFRVYGTTNEGTGTFIETHASTTSLNGGYYGTNGIYFKKYDGTTYAGLERVNYAGAGYTNFMILKQLAGDLTADFIVTDSSGNTITDMGVSGIILGSSASDTAIGKWIMITSPTDTRFAINGTSGALGSSGTGVFGVTNSFLYTPNAQLTASSTTEQLRLIYDETNNKHASFTVDSSGDLTLDLAIANATTTVLDNFQVEGNLVASSTFRVFGTTDEGTGTFIETLDNGTDVLGYTASNGINLKKYDGTLYGLLGRVDVGGNNYINALALKNITGDFGSAFIIHNSSGQNIIEMSSYNGIRIGDDSVDTASSVDIRIVDSADVIFEIDGAGGNIATIGIGYFGAADAEGGAFSYSAHLTVASSTEQLRLSYEDAQTNYASFTVDSGGDLNINTTGGDVGIGSSTPSANLSVGADTSATTTVDFAKPCFRMTTDDGTTLYYWPCIVNCGNDGGWATSTTSCF